MFRLNCKSSSVWMITLFTMWDVYNRCGKHCLIFLYYTSHIENNVAIHTEDDKQLSLYKSVIENIKLKILSFI